MITFDAQPKIALIIILPTVKFSTGHSPIKSYFASLTVLCMSMLLQSTIYLGWCYLVTKSSKMYWDYLIETVKMKVSDEQYKKKYCLTTHR